MPENILERFAKRASHPRFDVEARADREIGRYFSKIKRQIARHKSVSNGRGGLYSMGARGPVVKAQGLYGRRVIVKAKYVASNKDHARVIIRHHLHYAAHNKNIESDRSPKLYDHDNKNLDIKEKVEGFQKAPHFFNIIISPEDGEKLDLKEFTRDLVARIENDLGTRLDWAAGNHYDTNDPHVHLLFKGEDDQGNRLLLTRDYISRGLRARASQVATEKLGLRNRDDVVKSLELELSKTKVTELDRLLIEQVKDQVFDLKLAGEGQDLPKSLFIERLTYLESKELVKNYGHERWLIDAHLMEKLKELGRTASILERLSGGLKFEKEACEIVSAQNLKGSAIKGHVVERGFVDGFGNNEYLVVKSKEKKFAYVELEKYSEKSPAKVGEYIQVEATKPFDGPRISDRNIFALSQKDQGIYDVKAHEAYAKMAVSLPPGVSAKEFVSGHVKRLETLAKMGLVEKLDGGRFAIGHDYLERISDESERHREKFCAHIKVTRLAPSRINGPSLDRGLSL